MKEKNTNNPISKTDNASQKSTKTPQWIRDIAASSKLNEEKKDINIQPNIQASQQFTYKNIKTNKERSKLANEPDNNHLVNDKIKKVYRKLVNLENQKYLDEQDELKMEKSLEEEEGRIEKLFNDKFKS